jgi:TatD DNase family protein
LPIPLVDSHTHLDFPQFDADREAVIARAREAGLAAILNVGTDLPSSRAAVALAEQYDFIYAAVGVHPHDARTVTPAVLDELRALARRPKVVAVGEIGLDYYRDLSPRPVQRQAFADQLALATELSLPVVIHSREAYDDVLATLRGWKGTGVIHSYSAGSERLEEVLALGFSIGIPGPVTFRRAHHLLAVSYRGRRNEPAYVRYVAEAVARARGISDEALARATADNARRLFDIV